MEVQLEHSRQEHELAVPLRQFRWGRVVRRGGQFPVSRLYPGHGHSPRHGGIRGGHCPFQHPE
eukprot:1004858-Rhodomonas_salina.1